MKKIIITLVSLFCSILYSQKLDCLNEVTEHTVKLYIKDTLKKTLKDSDYIVAYIHSDVKLNTIGLSIDTFSKDELFKKTSNYRSFKFEDKKLIIFCDLNSTQKCNEYFKKLKFEKPLNLEFNIKDQEVANDELDKEVKPWSVYLNKDYKIIKVSGKIIEAEIANPKDFKVFLKRFSNLKLYQLTEKGPIVYPKP